MAMILLHKQLFLLTRLREGEIVPAVTEAHWLARKPKVCLPRLSLHLTYADPSWGGLKQGGVRLDKTRLIRCYGRGVALLEGLTPDRLVDTRMNVLFALLPKLKGGSLCCLGPTCLKGFSGGSSAFLLFRSLTRSSSTQRSPGAGSPVL